MDDADAPLGLSEETLREQRREQIAEYIRREIRKRRRIFGLTQAQLASPLGIQFQQVQKIESGDNQISAVRLFEMEQELHWPIERFFPPSQKNDHAEANVEGELDLGTQLTAIVEALLKSGATRVDIFDLVIGNLNKLKASSEKEG